jgi:hypothetical protein
MVRSAQKLRRLVDVFHDLETIERVRVSELAQEMGALRSSQEDILRSLENPSPISGLFTALLSNRVGRLERRIQQLSREHELALKRYSQAAGRRQSATQLFANALGEENRKREQLELEALLEFQESVAAQGRGKSPSSS